MTCTCACTRHTPLCVICTHVVRCRKSHAAGCMLHAVCRVLYAVLYDKRGLEHGVRAPVFYGNLREQTGENGIPRIPTGSLCCSYRNLRKYSETSESLRENVNLGILYSSSLLYDLYECCASPYDPYACHASPRATRRAPHAVRRVPRAELFYMSCFI